MKIKNARLLVLAVNEKKLQDGSQYWQVSAADSDGDGQNYQISVRDKDMAAKIKPMTVAVFDIAVQNSKYGMKLVIEDVKKTEKEILA